jgi:hypothetical protein
LWIFISVVRLFSQQYDNVRVQQWKLKPKSQRMFPKNIRTLVCSNSDSTTFLLLLLSTTIKESSFSHLHHRHTHWHPKSKWRGNWSLCIHHLQISSHDQQQYTWFSCTLWWATQLSQYSVWLRAGRPSDRDSIPGRGERIFPLALCPDRLWSPPSLLYNEYRGSFPRG